MHGHPTEEDHEVSTTSRSSEDVAAALARLGSATIGESGGLAADRRLRPAWSGAAVAAPAYPVGCTPGDNLAVHVRSRRRRGGACSWWTSARWPTVAIGARC